MQLRQLEQALTEIAAAEKAKARSERQWRPLAKARILMSRRRDLRPTKDKRDLLIAGLGIMLGVGCAVFPWYIFMNQDKFGVRAMVFEGNGDYQRPVELGSTGERVGAPMSTVQIPPMKLDLFATGGISREHDEVSAAADQPFPGEPVEYRMVYAAVGRAMIADDAGFWVVQRGSLLPDNSKVESIEQRSGKWVLVTSDAKVLPLSKD